MEENVLLFIADISGYTKYMVENKNAYVHAQIIITELLETIIEELELPFEVSKLEGDAVFFYHKVKSDEVISDLNINVKIFSFHEKFSEKINELINSTLCNCGSCKNIDKLKLKIIVHYGKALFSKISEFDELSGIDVIIVHRLLKNSINSNQYIATTLEVHDLIGFEKTKKFSESTENYGELGKIKIKYIDLKKKIESRKRNNMIRLIKTMLLMMKTKIIRINLIKLRKLNLEETNP